MPPTSRSGRGRAAQDSGIDLSDWPLRRYFGLVERVLIAAVQCWLMLAALSIATR